MLAHASAKLLAQQDELIATHQTPSYSQSKVPAPHGQTTVWSAARRGIGMQGPQRGEAGTTAQAAILNRVISARMTVGNYGEAQETGRDYGVCVHIRGDAYQGS